MILQRLIPILMSLALAFSLAAAPTLAYAALSTGFGEEAQAERVAVAEEKARELESRIDALPDDAGIEYKETVRSIRGEMQGSTTSRICPPENYMSSEHRAKISAIEKNIHEAEEAERSTQAATQTTTTTASTPANATPTPSSSSRQSSQSQDQTLSTVILVALIAWEAIWVIQVVLSYGTAYRKTKKGGDNGVALFGWMLVYSFASVIPGLGFYLWSRNK